MEECLSAGSHLFPNMRKEFASLAASMGGDVTVLYLPDVGIYGNSHFMFQELNNMEIADYLYSWLSERGLD